MPFKNWLKKGKISVQLNRKMERKNSTLEHPILTKHALDKSYDWAVNTE